ncbi:hypothetical protein [Clostridium psychrophilum]|uniref:hypothetical protein n=1 Tax=Clostridium psychrophilum TaxID=132926 RepID=UPI001C0C0CBE|nr:hypothetical protein [Clostridium psychrophilum]MBU3182907.1 hypothetical protein [Clostridium psychrophilum]
MKLKTWVLWLLAGSGCLFLGIIDFFDKNYFSAVTYTFFVGISIVLSIIHYKKDKKSN